MRHNPQLAFIFPGQGSQQVGMLKESYAQFPLVRKTFEEASRYLGKSLWPLASEGPLELLHATENTQPVLLTASVALWRVWQSGQAPSPAWLAGHSLGEYSALVCAEALSFEEGLRLVALRGKCMQEAVPEGVGAMASVLGLEAAQVFEICQEAQGSEIVAVAGENTIGQTVIAGHQTAVSRAMALARLRGAKKVVLLPVSVPSHCALMKHCEPVFQEALASVRFTLPRIPLLHNADVAISHHPDEIRMRLLAQLSQPVRWVETIQRFVVEGIQIAVECGPGRVLTGLVKRIDPRIKALSIEEPATLLEMVEATQRVE